VRNRVRVMCKPGSVGDLGGQPPRSTRPDARPMPADPDARRPRCPPTPMPAEPVGLGLRSPLAYNGLAFAGANLPQGELPDGGILSAEAIAGLPLGGLRLAVLAACETGLGELTEGEGVRGLVHAFHIAGCPDVVATLWNVDDEAAAAVVKLLYQDVWRKNLGPLAALRRAQLLVLRNPERIGELAELEGAAFEAAAAKLEGSGPGGGGPAERTPPRRWAAFSLSGAGR
jgi:CHAT domain